MDNSYVPFFSTIGVVNMKETFAKLLKALGRIFDAFTTLADSVNDLAKSTKNITEGIEVSSRSLIPSQEEMAAEAEIARLQAQVRIVEKLNELKKQLGNDVEAIKKVDDQIERIKQANKPKSDSDSDQQPK